MAKVKLIIDSDCNLEKGLAEQYGAIVVPSTIIVDGQEYKDGFTITPRDIYRLSSVKGKPLPKTSAINEADFYESFRKALAEYDGAVFITISAALSASYRNAMMAIQALNVQDRIVAIDTKSLSCGIAIVAERAAADIAKGFPLMAMKKDLDDVAARTTVEFVIDTLDNLYKGGRCSGLSYIFGKALHIHPVIGMDPVGHLFPLHKVRGKDIGNGVEQIFQDFKKDWDEDNVDKTLPVYCTHAAADPWERLATAKVKALVGNQMVVRNSEASSVIAVHCGPGTFGIGWTRKKPNA